MLSGKDLDSKHNFVPDCINIDSIERKLMCCNFDIQNNQENGKKYQIKIKQYNRKFMAYKIYKISSSIYRSYLLLLLLLIDIEISRYRQHG